MVKTVRQDLRSWFETMAIRAGMNPVEAKRFAKFAVVGVFGAVVDSVVFNVGLGVGLPATVAGAIALALAVISNYIWNRYWTYPDSRSKPILNQFLQFFFVNILALGIRVPTLNYLPPPLIAFIEQNISALAPFASVIGNNLAWTLAVGIAMFWNFFVNRYWTYNDVD